MFNTEVIPAEPLPVTIPKWEKQLAQQAKINPTPRFSNPILLTTHIPYLIMLVIAVGV